MREAQPDEPPERWVAKVAPELDLSLIHRRVVVLAHGLDRVVLRRVRLDDHAAAPGTPPGATGHLLQQLECALGGAEVREVEPGVRRDHADECDERHVEPLRDHLRADQHIRLVCEEAGEDRFVGIAPAGDVAVPAEGARLRKGAAHLLLDALGAQPDLPDAAALAFRTARR